MAQLLDQFGRPIPPLKRPETREIGSVSIRDRWSGYPSAGLTPQRLAAIFRAADWGDLRSQAECFEEMEEKDAHLGSVMQTRRLAVLGLERQVEAASDSAEDQKIADFCQEQIENLDMESLGIHLLGAIGHGYAAAETLWEPGSQTLIRGFNLIHPKNVTFINSLIPLIITEDNFQGVEPKPFQLVYHRYAAKSGHDTRNGVLRVVGYIFLFKNYAIKDWATFNEVFGMPLRVGKYDPSASKEDREALKQAIHNLGSDAAGVISKATEIEFVEAAQRLSGSTNPYEVMANFCNREMSKAVLGQTLTTDTQGSTGTYAAGKVQADVRRDLLEADAKGLAKTLRLQILRPLVGFNFGWDKAVPGLTLIIQEAQDLKADSEMVKNLAEAGARIPQKWVYDHFGFPEPGKADEILQPPVNIQAPPVFTQPGPQPPQPGVAAHRVVPLKAADGLQLIAQDRQVIAAMQEMDNLTAAALQASADAVSRMLAPVQDLIDRGASLEEIRAGLLSVYPQIEAGELEEALYQAMVLANLRGRLHGV